MTTAVAGRCGCGQNILRADADGQVVTTEVWPADAAAELRAWATHRPSYAMELKHGQITLHPRGRDDIRLRPAGFNRDRILLTHQCPEVSDV